MLMASTTPSKHETNAGDASSPLAKFRDFLVDEVRPVCPPRSPCPPRSLVQRSTHFILVADRRQLWVIFVRPRFPSPRFPS
jgi:hypothetical protein